MRMIVWPGATRPHGTLAVAPKTVAIMLLSVKLLCYYCCLYTVILILYKSPIPEVAQW